MHAHGMSPTFVLLSTLLSSSFVLVASQTSYANDFPDPDYIVAGAFPNNTLAAQETILDWASRLARDGPWSVTSKDATPPSGTKHDFMSWAPYWWPDCSEVGNSTALPESEIWTTCPYVRRDGQFNPDVRGVNDIGNFQTMSDAVFFNTLAWSLDREDTFFSRNAVRFMNTWFLDEETRMNPNLNFAQMIRGSNGRPGSATGVLDLKGMTKIAASILILRKAENPDWTAAIDEQMVAWTSEYIEWLETAELALQEGDAANNHGTFYYNQLAAAKLIVGDTPGAVNVTRTYFSKQFLGQIEANGEQPLEAARTRPYHYRAYNLAAMITNARLEKYADPNSTVWNRTTTEGANIQDALDFAMTFSASSSGEDRYADELYPNVAAVASVYGDPDGAYLKYMKEADAEFYAQPHFLWNHGNWAESEGIPTGTAGSKPKATSRVEVVDDSDGVAPALSVYTLSAFTAVVCSLLFTHSL